MQYPTSTSASVRCWFLLALPCFLLVACTQGAKGAGTGGTSIQGGAGGKAGAGGTSSTGGAAGSGGTTAAGGSGGAAGGAGGAAGAGGGAGSGGRGGSGGAASTGGSTAGGAGGNGGSGGIASGGGPGGRTGTGGSAGGAAGNASATGGSTLGSGGSTSGAGGITGVGGSTSGMCASAFFSTEASGKKSAEYAAWKKAFVQDCSNGSAVVKNGGGVVSEGIGYGMLLAVNNDDQALFDKLWKFYMDHLDPNGLMNWGWDACAPPGNNNSNAATDADLDAAMGLLVADKRWGGYQKQAQELIGKIKEFETDTCQNGLALLRPGDKWGGCTESATRGKTNPSYFAPAYYRAFATVDTANADFWKKLATDSYTLLAQYQKTMNGLVPNWGFSDGTTESNDYGYDACRTPWRIAMDYMWYCTPEAKTVLENFSKFVDGKGGVTKTGYANNSAFVGAFADAGIAISQAKIDAYVKDWMGASGMDDTPYFQGTLRPLYLLVAGGQFMSAQ